MATLTDRWPVDGAEELREALLTAWAEPRRGYHDVQHLSEVLDRLDELATALRFDRVAVSLAAWFHDAVYDGQELAEERSARWAENALPGVGLSPATVTEVARLVRLTEHHRPAAADAAGCAMTDADLAILAAPPERYREYTAGVRREYAQVPEADFAAGRAAVLRDLASREELFCTAYGREHWQPAARANLSAELAELAGGPSAGRAGS